MKNKKILLIITGSIAAYKAMDLVRLLKKRSFDITCVLTKSAEQFITPLLASSLSGNKTYNELFAAEDHVGIDHIKLSREADLIVVAPATADFMAKMANGFADDLASNVILASNKKIIVAPAMNEKMWQNKQTEKNVSKLIESGILMVEPESDMLACGEIGIGKMAVPEKICDKIHEFFENKNRLLGRKVLITGGATFEPIDPVRFIGNRSSGKQAIALVKVFSEMGADVTFIAANIHEAIPLKKEQIINVKTADEMFAAVRSFVCYSEPLSRHPESSEGSLAIKKDSSLRFSKRKSIAQDDRVLDVFIACAAVADFKVKNIVKEKIKKTAQRNLKLELVQNPDILEFVGHSKSRPKLVIGFAAESSNIKNYAKEKLKKKNCDLIVANDIEGGEIFGSSQTEVMFISNKKIEELGKISKEELAGFLAARISIMIENI